MRVVILLHCYGGSVQIVDGMLRIGMEFFFCCDYCGLCQFHLVEVVTICFGTMSFFGHSGVPGCGLT